MGISFAHHFPFDPSYGYNLERLLQVQAPAPPLDFVDFWQKRYAHSMTLNPQPTLTPLPAQAGFDIYNLRYNSTDKVTIQGWVAVPHAQVVTRAVIIGHGYGGCSAPEIKFSLPNAAFVFPCFRGLNRSELPRVSTQPEQHVLSGIDDPEHYILGGCVEDLWLAVSSILQLFPATYGHIGYAGISFGGGIGALALPWDLRIERAHLNVPTFGDQPLRLQLPTVGSGEGVRRYQAKYGNVMSTLQYYDAASAARFIHQPMHIAAALFDPVVAPPGQFAVYNALEHEKYLFVLDAGHFDYPQQTQQAQALKQELEAFFHEL